MDVSSLAERKGEVQIIDVRYPNEWEAGRIYGAVHIPEDDLADRLDEIDRQRPLVTVCRSGNRSGRAAALLKDEGFDAENLEGGMEAWAGHGLPVTTPDGEPGSVVEPVPPPDDRPPEHQRLQSEFLGLIFEVKEHFGDRQPSEEDVRAFLRERLIAEGKTPEEADEFLENMGDDEAPEGAGKETSNGL